MKKTITIWGKQFSLDVDFDVYDGEEVTQIQRDAIELFLKSSDRILSDSKIIQNYCKNQLGNANNQDEDIFRYILPKTIYVVRSPENRVIALLCDSTFDIEHGIAVIYENEQFSRIAVQDELI